jgi:hypothetical protein
MMTANKKEPEPSPTPASTAPAAMNVTPVVGHQFGDSLMSLFADLVLKAATSQRTAAGVSQLVATMTSGYCSATGARTLFR